MYIQPWAMPTIVVIVVPVSWSELPSAVRYFSGRPTKTSTVSRMPTMMARTR